MLKAVALGAVLSIFTLSAEPLRVVTGDFEPFTGESLYKGGPFAQRVHNIFKHAGISIFVDFRPWKRGYLETKQGKYAATFPYSYNQEREKLFYYSDPVDFGHLHLYVNKASGLSKFKGFAELAGKRLYMPVGFNLYEHASKAVAEGTLILQRVAAMEQCFDMLDKGRTDLTQVRPEVAEQALRKKFGSEHSIVTLHPPVMSFTEHVIFPKSKPESAELLEIFNQAMHSLDDKAVKVDK